MFNSIVSGAQPQLGGNGGAFNAFGPAAQQVLRPSRLYARDCGGVRVHVASRLPGMTSNISQWLQLAVQYYGFTQMSIIKTSPDFFAAGSAYSCRSSHSWSFTRPAQHTVVCNWIS